MRDPSVLTYGVSYRPMQMLSFHVNHQQEMGGQKQWSGGLSIHYQLGVPLSEQMKPVPEDYGSLDTMRYAFVQRNYTMPLNYKDIAALSVVLNSGTLTDGMTLNPTISSSRGITSVIWTGTLAKYLNSTNTEHPIIQNLPVGITKGTLNVMVEDNSGKTESATGNFTATVLPTLTAIAKANNETGTAIVSGKATPETFITILFPDGEKRKLTVAPSGQYSATSAKYMSNGNIQVIETINGVTAKKSLAFKQMVKPTFGKAKVTPDSHNDAVINGKGATPNSTITVTYPDGSQQTVKVNPDGTYQGQSTGGDSDGG